MLKYMLCGGLIFGILNHLQAQIELKKIPIETLQGKLELWIHTHSENGLVYLGLHDDENTSVAAGLESLPKTGGRLIELKHIGILSDTARYVSIQKKQKIYTFDPNRIFSLSDSVRAQTLLLHRRQHQTIHGLRFLKSTQIPTEAECMEASKTWLKAVADTILTYIRPEEVRLLVSLHNNHSYGGGCDCKSGQWALGSYNLNHYINGNTLEKASCEAVFINPRQKISDFLVVLNPNHFKISQEKGANVVLQSETPIDDGSLSVFSSIKKIPYVNVEAKRGNLTEQIFLLELIQSFLNE